MEVRDLRWGSAETLELRHVHGDFDPVPPSGKESRLILQHDDVLLSVGEHAWTVVGATARAHAALRDAAASGGTCVTWIAQSSPRHAIVQVRRFGAEMRVEGAVAIRVDEGTREAVQSTLGLGGTVAEIARRLDDLLLLPARPGDADSLRRAVVVVGEGAAETAFRIVGTTASIDVEARPTGFVIQRVVKGGPPRDAATRLFAAGMSFVDASETGALSAATRAELEAAVRSSGSYFKLWRAYSDIDRHQTEDRAARFGALPYGGVERVQGGWKVTLNEDALAAIRVMDESPDVCVRLTRDAPPPRASDPEDNRQARTRKRRDEVVLQFGRLEGRTLYLRTLEEDRQETPPEQGWISLSVAGDEKRIERRESAEKRIREGSGPMGTRLGLLLEGRPGKTIHYPHRSPRSHAVLEALGNRPTASQIEAVDVALNTPDIAMIQGPPGTGKTSVITAIERRIAELDDEPASFNHRVLVASAQHDAVENVAGRTRVFGLPAVKIGRRRRGGGTGSDPVARFQRDQAERLRAKLGTIKDSERLRRARELAVALMVRSGSALQTVDALREIRAQVDGLIPPALLDKLDTELARVSRNRSAADDSEREVLLRAARGIREEGIAFEDDGPVKARVALTRLAGVLQDDERDLLQRCADWDAPGPPPCLEEVAAMKAKILDRLLSVPSATEGGIDGETRELVVRIVDALRAGLGARRTLEESVLANFLRDVETDPDGVGATLRDYTAVLASTLQHAAAYAMYAARSISEGSIEFNSVIVDEAARAHPLDLFIPMSMASRRIVLVGDHRQLPHMLEPAVERELTAGLSDGDLSKETDDALKKSLFERLWHLLKEQERRDGIPRTVTLDAQFRMHPVLGAFVSEVFYERKGDPRIASPLPASDFAHGLQRFTAGGHERVAAWLDVPSAEGSERRVSTSLARIAEARRVAALADEILDADPTLSVGVISFYSAQDDAIQRELERSGIMERDGVRRRVVDRFATGRDRRGASMERFRIGTVDAFQGKEFDVVILSITRSNSLFERTDEERRKKFGHLMLDNRLCVALSRQRRLLVTVGDLGFARKAHVLVPIGRLISLCEGDHGVLH